jgi:hypothetical protein
MQRYGNHHDARDRACEIVDDYGPQRIRCSVVTNDTRPPSLLPGLSIFLSSVLLLSACAGWDISVAIWKSRERLSLYVDPPSSHWYVDLLPDRSTAMCLSFTDGHISTAQRFHCIVCSRTVLRRSSAITVIVEHYSLLSRTVR